MTTGVEWALQAVMKSLQLDPEEVKASLAKTVQIIVTADDRLARMEANQLMILSALAKLGAIDNADGPEFRRRAIANGSGQSEPGENGSATETGDKADTGAGN